MTMPTHPRGPSDRAAHSAASGTPAGAGVTAVYLAKAKRVLMPVLMALAGVAAVTAIMALKIAIYLPRLIHH
ncbi:MAG TPA: hypothetical protein VN926_20945 [Bradyrhizobium sp.]|jgi:hypothetical protein|nr:hypothetical protein [Bradyrhizobium sp.]